MHKMEVSCLSPQGLVKAGIEVHNLAVHCQGPIVLSKIPWKMYNMKVYCLGPQGQVSIEKHSLSIAC